MIEHAGLTGGDRLALPQRSRIGELERMQALAQHRFHRGFPAVVDAQLLPQPRGLGEAVALEPVVQRRIVLGRDLDLAQGLELRLRGGMLALCGAQGFRGGGAALVCGRVLGLRFLECLLRLGEGLLQLIEILNRARPRLAKRLQLGFEPLAALLQRLLAALEVREVRLLELQAFSACESALRAASSRSCAPRNACSACGSESRSFSSFSFVPATRSLASPTRAAQVWSDCVSCARCSRQDASCARRSVCWLSRRLRVSSACLSSDSKRATSAFAAYSAPCDVLRPSPAA